MAPTKQGLQLSGYRLMWLMVMFDLPVVTAPERKAATGFRNHLLSLGFEMSQFSVYLRFCTSHKQAQTLCNRIEEGLPSGGRVNVLEFTDKQYERTRSYRGKTHSSPKTPDQFSLF